MDMTNGWIGYYDEWMDWIWLMDGCLYDDCWWLWMSDRIDDIDIHGFDDLMNEWSFMFNHSIWWINETDDLINDFIDYDN